MCTVMSYENVAARAMLVSLQISLWSARKFDRKASVEVIENHAADRKAGRFNKHLLAGAISHAVVIKQAGEARMSHWKQTLPWADEGWRLLPTSNYMEYTETMRKERRQFETAIDTFIDEYPALRNQARVTLGSLYCEEEFPGQSDMRRRFGWAINFQPVPSASDIRVELPADYLSQIEQQITTRVEQATKDAMHGAWERLHEAVVRIQKASSENGIVRSNLIEHARETCDLLARLNVMQDEPLEEMRQRVERELIVLTVEDLRKNDQLRIDTERRAADIILAMGAFYTPMAEQEVA